MTPGMTVGMMLGMTTVPFTHALVVPYIEELCAIETVETASDGRELKLVLYTGIDVHMRLWLRPGTVTIERRHGALGDWGPGDLNDLDELLASAEDEGLLSPIATSPGATSHRRIVREARRMQHGVTNGLIALQADLRALLIRARSGQPVGEKLQDVAMLAQILSGTAKVHDSYLWLLMDPKE
jgi:hypothetical protein